MKLVGLRETKQALSDYVNKSQREPIVITKRGRPAAILIGVEGVDRAALAGASGSDLWKLVGKRGKRAAASTGTSRRAGGAKKR